MHEHEEGQPTLFGRVTRRGFLELGARTAALVSVAGFVSSKAAHAAEGETTIAGLQAAMGSGQLTASGLVDMYLARIDALDRRGPRVNSIIEVNPDARAIALALDAERKAKGPRGPLHGIPIILKDNIDTADRMMTAAGSLALVGAPPLQDATVAAKLRAAGAILLGKANLSEWANFRGFYSTSGWSARGGLTRNPYVLDRSACGSSAGSAAAVAADLCAAALGTETDGSIICPSSACGVVGMKPTVGLLSRAGIIPISHSQDTAGPHARSVADAAILLGALTGVDPRDSATSAGDGRFLTDYTTFLDSNGLKGARIGIARKVYFGSDPQVDAIAENAIRRMKEAGAEIIDPANIPTAQSMAQDESEFKVLLYEFKADLNAYLAARTGIPVRTLEEAIAFNKANADVELQYFGQELFEQAQEKGSLVETSYVNALKRSQSLARERGIDAVMDQQKLDAIFAPTIGPAWGIDLIYGDRGDSRIGGAIMSPAARAGYPHITVPAGFIHGLPVGVSFVGRAFSEPTLIKIAHAFEQITKARRAPQFLPTLPTA
jgi:amidase